MKINKKLPLLLPLSWGHSDNALNKFKTGSWVEDTYSGMHLYMIYVVHFPEENVKIFDNPFNWIW